MERNEDRLVQHILQRAEDIYNMLSPGIPTEWFSSDLTVAQLRVLLVLHSAGPSRMSAIASVIDIALPTATGIVDKLVNKGLVIRETDTQDRRQVICRLSPAGQDSINRLWTSSQFQMEKLLEGLTEEELEKAAEVAQMLFNNLANRNQP
jgi:DNA-binding MarR family transcriptional regulator